MNTDFATSFDSDVKKIISATITEEIEQAIFNVEEA